jgi:hypothetical protein
MNNNQGPKDIMNNNHKGLKTQRIKNPRCTRNPRCIGLKTQGASETQETQGYYA